MTKEYEITLSVTVTVKRRVCADNEEQAEMLAQEIIDINDFDVADYDEITDVDYIDVQECYYDEE